VFVPGATIRQTLAFLEDYNNQYKFYAPEVQRSRVLAHDGDHFEFSYGSRNPRSSLSFWTPSTT